MLRLLALLNGAMGVKTQKPVFVTLALLSFWISGLIVLDVLNADYFSVTLFLLGVFLALEGVIGLIALIVSSAGRCWSDLVKATVLILLGVGMASSPQQQESVLLLLAIVFLADGVLCMFFAVVMRYWRWYQRMLQDIIQIAVGLFILLEEPPHFSYMIFPLYLAFQLMLLAINFLRLSWQISRLPDNTSVTTLPMFAVYGTRRPRPWRYHHPASQSSASQSPLIINIWMPVGSTWVTRCFPLLNRWVFAIDHKGMVSTGHISLEKGNEFYISHYPKDDIDFSAGDFIRALRADEKFDVHGHYRFSLPEDIAEYSTPYRKLEVPYYNEEALDNYWAMATKAPRYNPASFNCASSAVMALDVAIEGVLADRGIAIYLLLLDSNFWLLYLLRSHAESMAWTPGSAMDYISLLNRLTDPHYRHVWISHIATIFRWIKGECSSSAGEGAND